MKRLSIIAILVAVVFCLLSCSQDSSDTVGYVQFSSSSSRALTASSYDAIPFDDLYWYYEATKADGFGTSGQTGLARLSDTAGLPTKPVGPFSIGKWKFRLSAYDSSNTETGTLVYQSSEIIVSISSELQSVGVSVIGQNVGSVALSGVSSTSFESASIKLLSSDSIEYTKSFASSLPDGIVEFTNGEGQKTKYLPVGSYTCTFTVDGVDEELSIVIINGAVTLLNRSI